MLEWTRKSDSLHFPNTDLFCTTWHVTQADFWRSHSYLDQILVLNYHSFRLKEWDYFLPYWKTYLFPIYSHIFFLFWTISRGKKKKVGLTQMGDDLFISSSISFHASLTSQHYNLFELPSVISTPPCWPLLTHSLLVGSAGLLHNQGFVMLSDRLQVTILKQLKDCFLSWYSSPLVF